MALDQSDFVKLRRDDFLVERLHDVLVGARVKRAGDVRDIVLGRAENDLRHVAAGHQPQVAEEFDSRP